MTYELSLLPEIEEDALAGYLWYEERSSGLGDQFLEELYIDIGAIPSNSLLSQVVHQGIRRRLLRRFPYAIYFSLEEAQILCSMFSTAPTIHRVSAMNCGSATNERPNNTFTRRATRAGDAHVAQ